MCSAIRLVAQYFHDHLATGFGRMSAIFIAFHIPRNALSPFDYELEQSKGDEVGKVPFD